MEMNSRTILPILLWAICAFHVIVGAGLNLVPGFPQIMAEVYGAQIEWTAQFQYILKPLGAFMLALGFMAAIAARDPLSNKAIIYGFAILFALRALQRLAFRAEIDSTFAISFGRNVSAMVFFLVFALALTWLVRQAASDR